MESKVRVGGKDILLSGSFITMNNDSAEISIDQVRYIFDFIDDGTEPEVSYTTAGGSVITYKLKNFRNALGNGVDLPAGKFDDKNAILRIIVYGLHAESLTQSMRVVHYALLLGGAAR